MFFPYKGSQKTQKSSKYIVFTIWSALFSSETDLKVKSSYRRIWIAGSEVVIYDEDDVLACTNLVPNDCNIILPCETEPIKQLMQQADGTYRCWQEWENRGINGHGGSNNCKDSYWELEQCQCLLEFPEQIVENLSICSSFCIFLCSENLNKLKCRVLIFSFFFQGEERFPIRILGFVKCHRVFGKCILLNSLFEMKFMIETSDQYMKDCGEKNQFFHI